ncbi:MAG TPA: alkaline phosphatase family protein [Vicinamibacterales bacterium]
MLRRLVVLMLALAPALLSDVQPRVAAQAQPARNVILITLDGARTQEIFGGLDLEVLRSTLREGETPESTSVYREYWAPTPEERRSKLMPFFWGELMARHGSILGNRAKGSRFGVTNPHRFSYPGYAEILTGAARPAVDSNDPRRNPHTTVLEVLRRELRLPADRVAVFGSWRIFNWIAEHEEGAIVVNAGYEAMEGPAPIPQLSAAQFETLTPWDSVRHDYYTFRLAMAHLAARRPRVLYLALGETDDWAHNRRYDRTLQALALNDRYLRELWTWLQSDPEYRDNTAILITVDHGRGRTPSDWHGHGRDVDGAEETWLAAIGPDWPRRGEWADASDAWASQVAATLSRAAGVDLRAHIPDAGEPILALWK